MEEALADLDCRTIVRKSTHSANLIMIIIRNIMTVIFRGFVRLCTQIRGLKKHKRLIPNPY